jgi:hypothetical protein
VEVGSDNGYQNGKYNRRAERSLDPTDVSQRLVLSGILELPFGKGKHWNLTNPLASRCCWRLAVEPDLDDSGRAAPGRPRRQQQPGKSPELNRNQRRLDNRRRTAGSIPRSS